MLLLTRAPKADTPVSEWQLAASLPEGYVIDPDSLREVSLLALLRHLVTGKYHGPCFPGRTRNITMTQSSGGGDVDRFAWQREAVYAPYGQICITGPFWSLLFLGIAPKNPQLSGARVDIGAKGRYEFWEDQGARAGEPGVFSCPVPRFLPRRRAAAAAATPRCAHLPALRSRPPPVQVASAAPPPQPRPALRSRRWAAAAQMRRPGSWAVVKPRSAA